MNLMKKILLLWQESMENKPDFRTYITYLIERTRNDKEAEMNLIKKNIVENNFNDSKELQDLKEAFLVSGSAFAILESLMKAIADYDNLDVKLNLKRVLN